MGVLHNRVLNDIREREVPLWLLILRSCATAFQCGEVHLFLMSAISSSERQMYLPMRLQCQHTVPPPQRKLGEIANPLQ